MIGSLESNIENTKQEIKKRKSLHRYENIDFGIIQTLVKLWLGKNAKPVKTLRLTMGIKACLSLFDTISDLTVAIQLFMDGHWLWGVTILLIDYIPMWQVLLHTYTTNAWSKLNDWKEKLILVLMLFVAPISFPLLQIRWFLHFDTPKKELFNFLHQNCKVAELISGME